MHTIFKDFTFAAAHAIRGHTRGCQNLHGHNYRVRVHLQADRLDELGMVLDFADLKAMMQEILGPFDHRVINDIPPFDDPEHHRRAVQPSTSSRRWPAASPEPGPRAHRPRRGLGERYRLRDLRALILS